MDHRDAINIPAGTILVHEKFGRVVLVNPSDTRHQGHLRCDPLDNLTKPFPYKYLSANNLSLPPGELMITQVKARPRVRLASDSIKPQMGLF